MVIFFGDGIFCRKPQILLRIQRIIKTASGKAFNGLADIVHPLGYPRACELMYQFSGLGSILCRIDKFYLSCAGNLHLCILVYISIRMSRNRNRFLPVLHARLNPFYHDGGTKYCTVQDCTDRSVRALPHFFQIILIHPCRIWGDRGAFYGNLIFLCGICRVHCNLIISLITMFKSQIIILCI